MIFSFRCHYFIKQGNTAATHASTINCAASSFSITGSTAGATATLVYNNELIGQTVLDASGNGTITYAITSPDTTITLTVSKLHHKPYHSALNITGPCPFPPDLTTNAATGITTCSAFGNGDISNDWGSEYLPGISRKLGLHLCT